MSKSLIWGRNDQELWPTEIETFRDHLLRLDGDSRRMRFGMSVDDAFIMAYVERAD